MSVKVVHRIWISVAIIIVTRCCCCWTGLVITPADDQRKMYSIPFDWSDLVIGDRELDSNEMKSHKINIIIISSSIDRRSPIAEYTINLIYLTTWLTSIHRTTDPSIPLSKLTHHVSRVQRKTLSKCVIAKYIIPRR